MDREGDSWFISILQSDYGKRAAGVPGDVNISRAMNLQAVGLNELRDVRSYSHHCHIHL